MGGVTMRGFVIFGFEDSRGVHIHGSDEITSWQLHFSSAPIFSLRHEGPVRHINPVLDLQVAMSNPKVVTGMPGEWAEALRVLLSGWSPEPKEIPTQKELTE